MDWAKKQELRIENYQRKFFGNWIRNLIRNVEACLE